MAKAITNQFDGSFQAPDKYDSKYFKYLGSIKDTGDSVIESFRAKDLARIEQTIKSITDSIKNHIFLIAWDV